MKKILFSYKRVIKLLAVGLMTASIGAAQCMGQIADDMHDKQLHQNLTACMIYGYEVRQRRRYQVPEHAKKLHNLIVKRGNQAPVSFEDAVKLSEMLTDEYEEELLTDCDMHDGFLVLEVLIFDRFLCKSVKQPLPLGDGAKISQKDACIRAMINLVDRLLISKKVSADHKQKLQALRATLEQCFPIDIPIAFAGKFMKFKTFLYHILSPEDTRYLDKRLDELPPVVAPWPGGISLNTIFAERLKK